MQWEAQRGCKAWGSRMGWDCEQDSPLPTSTKGGVEVAASGAAERRRRMLSAVM